MPEINKLNHPAITGLQGKTHPVRAQAPEAAGSFQELLRQRIAGNTAAAPRELTFSKHAQARQAERNISLSPEELDQLGSAVEMAHQKGLNDTLVYMRNKAFIVNIPSKVVVTVVDGEDANTVFTNIDGAVIV